MKKNDEIEMLKDDVEIQSALAALHNSDGGKILVNNLIKDVINFTTSIAENFNSMTVQEFIAYGAKIKTNIDMIQVLTASESNKDYYKKLLEEELLKLE